MPGLYRTELGWWRHDLVGCSSQVRAHRAPSCATGWVSLFSMTPGFLGGSVTGIWGWVVLWVLCGAGSPVNCGMVSRIPGLHSLDASGTLPPLRQPKMSPNIVNYLLGANVTPPWELLVYTEQTKHVNAVWSQGSGREAMGLALGAFICWQCNLLPDTSLNFISPHEKCTKMISAIKVLRSISSWGGSKCVPFIFKSLRPGAVCLECQWALIFEETAQEMHAVWAWHSQCVVRLGCGYSG